LVDFELSISENVRVLTAKLIVNLSFNTIFHMANWVRAGTYLQLPLWQWGAGNVYLFVLSSWKVNFAENLIAVMGL